MKLPTMFDWYQERTAETAIYGDSIWKLLYSSGVLKDSSNVARLMRISYVGMGLGEVGEIQNKLKKIIRDSDGVITEQMKDDLRDFLLIGFKVNICVRLYLHCKGMVFLFYQIDEHSACLVQKTRQGYKRQIEIGATR